MEQKNSFNVLSTISPVNSDVIFLYVNVRNFELTIVNFKKNV